MKHKLYRRLDDLALPPTQTFAPHIIRPNFKTGPWIAGGAVKIWLQKHEVQSDVDVYCKSKRQHQELLTRLEARGFQTTFESSNAITMKFREYKGDDKFIEYDVQLIRKEFFKHPFDILDTYDFGQCQLVTDGYEVYGNPDWHKTELQIMLHKTDTLLKRFAKYYAYGYNVKPGTLTEWSKEEEMNFNFNGTDDY